MQMQMQTQMEIQQQIQIRTQMAVQDISCTVFVKLARFHFAVVSNFLISDSLFSTFTRPAPAKQFDTFRIQDFSFRRDYIARILTSDRRSFFCDFSPLPNWLLHPFV